LKRAEELMQIVEQKEKDTEMLAEYSKREKEKFQRKNEQLSKIIEREAECIAEEKNRKVRDKSEIKQRKVIKFAVAAISILMIYSMCVTVHGSATTQAYL
jgi:hypothetical protein